MKPSVATSAVRAARPSSSAFVATVMPCANAVTSPGARPARASAPSTAAITPADWSSGVVGAFDALGQAAKQPVAQASAAASQLAPQAVMSSIAEALVATAVGLAVAIPAVAANNFFQRLIKSILANTEALSRILMAHLASESDFVVPGSEAATSPAAVVKVATGGSAKTAGKGSGSASASASKKSAAADEKAARSEGEEEG